MCYIYICICIYHPKICRCAITQMTHDGKCDMLIYMSQSWNVNTRAKPECWHFNWGTYIFACHTSPSCVICFVASLTVSKTCILLARNDTVITSQHNYVTSRVWSHAHCSASTNERMLDLFRLTCRNVTLQYHIATLYVNKAGHTFIGWAKPANQISDCDMAHDWIWTNSDTPF